MLPCPVLANPHQSSGREPSVNNKNNFRATRRSLMRLLILYVSGFAAMASAATTQQILDRVMVFSPTGVINLATGNTLRPPDFTDLEISGTSFSTCSLTAVTGLYCLDGKSLRNWVNPTSINLGVEVLNCADPALKLDNKPDACTGMTVDQAGAIWLAGKKKNTHSVIKVVKKGAACPSGAWATLAGGQLCALEFYSGRPSLIDITPIDGDAAEVFRACPGCQPQTGVLGMEERKHAVFFPDPKAAAPITVVSSRDWGLSGKELLQDVALLQVTNGSSIDSYVIATTSTGRILAKNPAVGGAARQLFNIPAERKPGSQSCNSEEQQYGLRASSTAALVFVTDRNYCQVLALEPDSGALGALVNVQEEGVDLVLSTVDTTANPDIVLPPIGLAVAPGISFELTFCELSCTVVLGKGGTKAATFGDMQLVDESVSGATLFQIKGIPDCRYLTAAEYPDCGLDGVIVTGVPGADGNVLCAGVTCPPAAQWLNVTPLLPTVVGAAFKASRGGTAELPPLLISPQHRGQARNGHVFEALFVVTHPLARFSGLFTTEYDVPALENSPDSLGCLPDPSNLLAWDIATDVSEVYVSTGGRYVDMLINTGCGSLKGTGVRVSLLPYNLEITPDTFGPTLLSAEPVETIGNDAVFARLMQRLYADLGYAQRELACKKVDPVPAAGAAPLPANLCATLASIWLNGLEKLDKCILAGFQPKQSAGDENCQSFVSQLNNFASRVPTATPLHDVANRVGELRARISTLLHVYHTRYLPSIPAGGFCRETNSHLPTCPNPWD
jgi:hypothetical protein